jgi:signal transduction histidine kinase
VPALAEEIVAHPRVLVGQRGGVVSAEHVDVATVVTDPQRLRQILTNVMSNAVKYTLEGRVDLSVRREGSFIRFSVEDTGIGMAPEFVARLGEAFAQAQQAHAKIGNGLGINIVRQFTELLKGRIEVTSEEGRGTTFGIVIPELVDARRKSKRPRFSSSTTTQFTASSCSRPYAARASTRIFIKVGFAARRFFASCARRSSSSTSTCRA